MRALPLLLAALVAMPATAQDAAPVPAPADAAPDATPATASDAPAAPAPASASDSLPPPPVSRWDNLPRLQYRANYKPRALWVDKIKALDGKDGCSFKPDASGLVRLSVPFVVNFSNKGQVTDAQASAPECPALAVIVTQFAHELGPKIVVPPSGPPPYWRASHFLVGWKP